MRHLLFFVGVYEAAEFKIGICSGHLLNDVIGLNSMFNIQHFFEMIDARREPIELIGQHIRQLIMV